ncbi:DNA repair protein REV1 [Thrips palmi]|uniref:DNA repair protein REV1 n=1 Tax=Thrips palmi TaxID=161013 RepID=A0A6P9AAA9_THRPL|nr:DNA repair protein REV1 [Thrips palmi]
MNKKRQRMEVGGENGFEEWGGYMAAKKNKLQDQFQEQVKQQGQDLKSDIFKNVSVFVNGYTVPSADEIKRIMMVHGGVYHHYLSTERTTHIIASNLPDVKIKQMKSLLINIVKPEWITACLEAKHQVDFRPFLLISHQSRTQPSIRTFAGPSSSTTATAPHVSEDEAIDEAEKTDKNNKASTVSDIAGQGEEEDLFSSSDFEETTFEPPKCPASVVSPNSKGESNKARCATEPNFLSEFYNNSRLHHISTMAAMYKQLVTELRQKKNDFPGLVRLQEWKRQNGKVKNNLDYEDEDFDSTLNESSTKSGHPNHQKSSLDKVIMHIDMDCFFVSVGLRRYPHLRGQRVAVTHSKGNGSAARSGSDRQYEFNCYKERLEAKYKNKNGSNDDGIVEAKLAWTEGIDETSSLAEIASCSYEARKKGVKNGMFVGAALKLCPDLKTIPYDFEAYKEVADALYRTVASYTVDIEAVSCDEMLVDCTEVLQKANCSPIEFASFLRKEIKEKTRCPASTGFGSNRLLARLATRKAKPDGMFHLEPSAVLEFMKTIDVKDLPGVGYTMASRLQGMGISTCGEMQNMSAGKLNELGTKTGELLFRQCRGDDNRPLNFDYQRKSVSAEVNYGIRFKNHGEADVFIRQLSVEVQTRLAEAKMKGSSITLKLLVRAKDAPTETAKYMGHGVCDSMTRSITLPRAISDSDTITREALLMLKKLNVNPSDLRGIGIAITRLENLNNSSGGALDKFLVKSNNQSESTSPTKPPPKTNNKASSPKGRVNAPKVSPRKLKVFPQKGVLGIDQFMVARKKSSRKDNIAKLPAPNDLDLEVLEALPDDIRNEVLEAYSSNTENDLVGPSTEQDCDSKNIGNKSDNMASTSNLDISYSQVDPTFLDALPSQMRKELVADFHQRKIQKENARQTRLGQNVCDMGSDSIVANKMLHCHRKESILKSFLTTNEIKCMIRQWISQESQPHSSDIHILEHYFCDLVHEKSIENLNVILKFFRRCVLSHSDSIWRKKFHDILSTVQESMQQVYHSSLLVEDV